MGASKEENEEEEQDNHSTIFASHPCGRWCVSNWTRAIASHAYAILLVDSETKPKSERESHH